MNINSNVHRHFNILIKNGTENALPKIEEYP